MKAKGTFLTKRQIQILKLRNKGLSLDEIARQLGTTKANICIIEQSALRNIDKARSTLEVAKTIKAPIVINVPKGIDLYEIPGMIYEAADKHNKWIPYGGPSLLALIIDKAKNKIREREVLEDFEVAVTEDGKILVT